MKKFTFIYLFLFLAIFEGKPQQGYYCRFELGPTGDIFQYTDNGNQIGFNPVLNAAWGMAIGRNLHHYLHSKPVFTLIIMREFLL